VAFAVHHRARDVALRRQHHECRHRQKQRYDQ